jgi:hypothetical protein
MLIVAAIVYAAAAFVGIFPRFTQYTVFLIVFSGECNASPVIVNSLLIGATYKDMSQHLLVFVYVLG